jgi:molybdate/tungstate transport system substrate-binding protein
MLLLLGIVPAKRASVSVLYAASLTQTMEGPLGRSFQRDEGYGFAGEGKGSRALANLIRAGLRSPDVFISAEKSLYPGLRVFGRSELVVAYAPGSRYAVQLAAAAAGRESLASVLRTPGLRLARTDPKLDPKGKKTLVALEALGVRPGDDSQVFPEQDLLARVETGQADCGFFYTTETRVPGLSVVALPDGIGSRPGIAVLYAVEVMPNAPHPSAAKAFLRYILTGNGRRILERAGITYR